MNVDLNIFIAVYRELVFQTGRKILSLWKMLFSETLQRAGVVYFIAKMQCICMNQ